MAWNPEPEVAVARDAAKALGDVPICVVIWLTNDGQRVGVASYGRSRALCDDAGRLGKHIHKAALKWGEDG